MFLASSAKPIDDSLQNVVDEIEAQSPALLILAARQLRYGLRQTLVEITIKEPRPFNVLEEFIIRAGIELEPAPTGGSVDHNLHSVWNPSRPNRTGLPHRASGHLDRIF